jgi:hypothetical protein
MSICVYAFYSFTLVSIGVKVRIGQPRMRFAAKRVALVCMLLTLWSAVAFVAHHHLNKTDAQNCSVCVNAHTPAGVSTPQIVAPGFVEIASLHVESSSAKFRLVSFALSVRPPPQA